MASNRPRLQKSGHIVYEINDAIDSDDEIFFTIERKNDRGENKQFSEYETYGQDVKSNPIRTRFEQDGFRNRAQVVDRSQRERQDSGESCSSIVDGLLCEIYDRYHPRRGDSIDSDTFTEYSSTSDAFIGRSVSGFDTERQAQRLNRDFLEGKGKQNMVWKLILFWYGFS